MMVHVFASAAGLLLETAAGGDIDFAAENGLDAFVARGLIKINRAAKHAVVGDRQRGKSQLMRLVHQPIQSASAIEQRILRVQMKVDKVRVRHAKNLTSGVKEAQAKRADKLLTCAYDGRVGDKNFCRRLRTRSGEIAARQWLALLQTSTRPSQLHRAPRRTW